MNEVTINEIKRFKPKEETTLKKAVDLWCNNKEKAQKKYGHIINISSIAGLEGYGQSSGYNATKFAVRGLSNALYKEVRDFGVKVTCIYPGSVKTNFFDEVDSISAHDNMLMPSELVNSVIQLLETSFNFHPVNFEIRPLQPKGKIKKNKE